MSYSDSDSLQVTKQNERFILYYSFTFIAISTIRPFGLLQVEARSVSTLAVDVPVHGPVVEVNGCIWRLYIKKTLENDELYFCIGLEMRAPDKSK